MREQNAVDKYIRWSPSTALFEPVWKQRDILPFWLYPPTDVVNGNIVIDSTHSPSLLYKLPHSSPGQNDSLGNPLEINEIVFRDTQVSTSTSSFTVFVRDMGDRTQFMNAPVHVQTFAGTAQLAARLSENLFLPTRHDLLVNFGYIGQNANVRLFFCGKIYYPWSTNLQNKPIDRDEMIKEINYKLERRKYIYPFWLTTDGGVVSVPANATVEVDMSIGDDGAFEATHLNYFSTGAFEISIYNPQTRQTISNGPFHSTMMGNAQNPQPLPAPFLVPAGEVLRCTIKDLSGSTNNVYVTFRGLKCRAKIQSYADAMAMFGIPVPPKKAKAQKKIDARLTEAIG